MKPRHNPDVIYIVDSNNLESGLSEGRCLFNSLGGTSNNCIFHEINSEGDFEKAKSEILCDFDSRSGKMNAMPFIHLSFEGNPSGVTLNSKEVISWEKIISFLRSLQEGTSPIPISLTELSGGIQRFSIICSVSDSFDFISNSLKKMEMPFQSWISPKGKVQSENSVATYMSFYNEARQGDNNFKKLIENSNDRLQLKLGMVTTEEIKNLNNVGHIKSIKT